jgi:membrane-associated phospholipid phosphatase
VLVFIALFFAGLVGTARLLLKAHSLNEVCLGYLIGILSQLIAFSFLFN